MSLDRVAEALRLPGDDAVELLMGLPENQWFDRKSARTAPRDLATPLVALANAEGGALVVGIHAGNVEDVPAARLNDLRQAAADFTVPVVQTRFHEITTADGKTIAIIEVDPGTHLHETVRGDAYLRVGDESRRLTFVERRELTYERGSEVFSAVPLEGRTMGDLDVEQLANYREVIGASTAAAALRARDMLDPRGAPRIAAWLLFSRTPHSGFPSAYVRVLKYGATERGAGSALSLLTGHDVRCEGTIPQQVKQAVSLVDEWIPQRNALAHGRFHDQPMIPRDAWIEGIVNAVIHRSYANMGDHIRVEIFPNRIEVSSPGRFPSFADVTNPESIMRYARNPRIARACAELGLAHELGEGIRRMFGWMRERGLSAPVYTQTSQSVILTLFANPASNSRNVDSLPRGAVRLLELMRQAGEPLKTGEITELAAIARPTALRHLKTLREAGLITWNGDAPQDPEATWGLN